jgi:hypothetical protein
MPKKRSKKGSKAEVERRVSIVETVLIRGLSRAEVIQYAAKADVSAKKEAWGLSDRTIDEYIHRANENISRTYEDKRKDEAAWLDRHRAKAIRRFEAAHAMAVADKDPRTAAYVQKQINVLLGIEAPNRHEVSGPGGKDIPIEKLDIDQLIRIALHGTDPVSAATGSTGGSQAS